MASNAFDHLPAIVYEILPELDGAMWPKERHADCDNCTLILPERGPWAFTRETRCCTAHPPLANFLAGRALRRGGIGRDKLLARMEDPEGVCAWGIDPPEWLHERYKATITEAFGRDLELRCPLYIGGEKTCGIWHDRSAICRTWYCRHEDGLAGAVAWSRIQLALTELEVRLAVWAVEQGDPPDDDAPADEMAAWYERAATLVEHATAKDVEQIAISGDMVRRRTDASRFIQIRKARRRNMPVKLVASVSEMVRVDGDVLLTGYSSFDAVRAPMAVFELLARLDGETAWKDALAATEADLAARGVDTAWLTDALVAHLHRVGALRDPDGTDDLPYEVELMEMNRWSRAGSRKPEDR